MYVTIPFVLEAVGVDTDGVVKPLEQLSYAQPSGWQQRCEPTQLLDIVIPETMFALLPPDVPRYMPMLQTALAAVRFMRPNWLAREVIRCVYDLNLRSWVATVVIPQQRCEPTPWSDAPLASTIAAALADSQPACSCSTATLMVTGCQCGGT